MESNQSYKTAYDSAYARLIEQFLPYEKRLFEDKYVKCFFGNSICFLLRINIIRKILTFMYDITLTGMLGLQVCRTKYIDEVLDEAIKDGIDQIVILGAGFDTRAYRISDDNKIKIFEIDLPNLQEKKKRIIGDCFDELPKNIIYTQIDFNTQTLSEVFITKELDFSKPIVYLWEGVTQYITQEAVNNTLDFISKSSSGSKVIFTYILDSVIKGTSTIFGANNLVNYLNNENKSWIFGINPTEVGLLLKKHHLCLLADVGSDYYQENYLKPINRKLVVSEIERVVYAIVE